MYQESKKTYKKLFVSYGGIKSLLRSFYFHISFIVTLVLFNVWSEPEWWNDVLAIMPNLIGFSLGGYAIFLAFGNNNFQEFLSGSLNGRESPLIKVSASFAFFIIVQILSLVLAIIARSVYHPIPTEINQIFTARGIDLHVINSIMKPFFWFACFFVFIYGISLSAAATMAIFRISGWLDLYNVKNKKKKRPLKKRKLRKLHFKVHKYKKD